MVLLANSGGNDVCQKHCYDNRPLKQDTSEEALINISIKEELFRVFVNMNLCGFIPMHALQAGSCLLETNTPRLGKSFLRPV